MRILLVEDDKKLANTVRDHFQKKYIVDTVYTGNDGIYYAQINPYDLIIVDLILPDINGKEVCRMARASNIKTPILVLTGMTSVENKVEAFDTGVDDYLTKPFSFKELDSRINALIRRNTTYKCESIEANGIIAVEGEDIIVIEGKKIKLREKEFELFELLLKNQGATVARDRILNSIWEESVNLSSNTVEVHISRLRKTLEQNSQKVKIVTVPKKGYKLEINP